MSELDEVVGEFLVESYENLDRYDEELIALERVPGDLEILDSIFRTIHTIKGTCGFFGFSTLESVTHVAETLLDRLRTGELAVTEEIASALLTTGDTVRRLLEAIEATGEESDDDCAALVAELERLDTTGEPAGAPSAAGVSGGDPGEATAAPAQAGAPSDTSDSEDAASGADAPAGAPSPGGLAETTVRVDVGLLDDLMNLVGELVLARNQIVQLVAEDPDGEFAGASQRLNLITTELQEGVMKTRMQPIGHVWNKLPRVVRDLAVTCDKQVDLAMEGRDTELDKSLIEAIKDPLTHLVRNAVDHGIEPRAERRAAGKPDVGRLTLRAFHEGGQVNIEISDDGGGIDLSTIREKAVAKGIAGADEVARMGEREVANLVFAPGFSTASQVTNVSGRGVGMDVVRTNIERIGGTVDVSSELGAGTTFKIKIPLTLAIVPALVVGVDAERYAIPQLSLVELVRLEGDAAREGIELVHGAPVHRLRGQLLPIVHLGRELGRVEGVCERDVLNIVVLHADGERFGLVVDEIHDTQEIVVKPLGSHLREATLFAGATIMGDGRVALILDVLGVAERAQVVSESRERSARSHDDEPSVGGDARRSLLLVAVGEDRRAAVALSEVARLEEFEPSAIEWAGSHEVVQYRGDILPLVRLSEALGVATTSTANDTVEVVVHRHGDRQVGLVVSEILDVVDDHLSLDGTACRPGLLGSAVIDGHVTDVVDVDTVVATAGLPPPSHPEVAA